MKEDFEYIQNELIELKIEREKLQRRFSALIKYAYNMESPYNVTPENNNRILYLNVLLRTSVLPEIVDYSIKSVDNVDYSIKSVDNMITDKFDKLFKSNKSK